MKPPKITLLRWNSSGVYVGLEDDDGDDGICLARSNTSSNAMDACVEAVKRLRQLADKFELLAAEEDPYSSDVQCRINNRR